MVSQREHADLVAQDSEQPVAVVAKVLRTHLRLLSDSLAEGESVVFPGFGTFTVNDRGTAVFKPGASLRARVGADSAAPAKKSTAKTTAKKAAKKSTAKKAAKKAPAKKSTAKTTAKKAPAKKAPAKKPTKTARKK